MTIGWITDNGTQYFLDADGHMVTNAWAEKDGNNYYLGEDGTIMTGKITVNGTTYYLNEDGSRAFSGWFLVLSGRKWTSPDRLDQIGRQMVLHERRRFYGNRRDYH